MRSDVARVYRSICRGVYSIPQCITESSSSHLIISVNLSLSTAVACMCRRDYASNDLDIHSSLVFSDLTAGRLTAFFELYSCQPTCSFNEETSAYPTATDVFQSTATQLISDQHILQCRNNIPTTYTETQQGTAGPCATPDSQGIFTGRLSLPVAGKRIVNAHGRYGTSSTEGKHRRREHSTDTSCFFPEAAERQVRRLHRQRFWGRWAVALEGWTCWQ